MKPIRVPFVIGVFDKTTETVIQLYPKGIITLPVGEDIKVDDS